jgi:GNAT superfamily N-acetyltransferase
MEIQYCVTDKRVETETQMIQDGLYKFNEPHFGVLPKFNGIYAKANIQNKESIIAGAITLLLNDEMLLDKLWVDEKFRKLGIGKQMVEEVEKLAKDCQVKTLFTDTYGFQAPDFYLKLGFTVYGQVDGFMGGHSKIFFKKGL